jgi:protein-tyrosine phosphatase
MSRLQNLVELYGPELLEAENDSRDSQSVRKECVRIALINMKMSLCDGTPCFVIPNTLAIGSAGTAYNKGALQTNGITNILVLCGSNCKIAFPESFTYKRIAFEDKIDSASLFDADILDQCLRYMCSVLDEMKPARLLVHCYQGKSRSCAVVCAYLMLYRGFTLETALACIRDVRPQVDINPGFMSVLRRRELISNIDKA